MTHYTQNNVLLRTDLSIHMTHGDTSQNSQGFPFTPISFAFLPPVTESLVHIPLMLKSLVHIPLMLGHHHTRCPKFAIPFHTCMTALAVPSLRMSLSSALLVNVSSDSRVAYSSRPFLSPCRLTDCTLPSAPQTLGIRLHHCIQLLFVCASNGWHHCI